MVIQFGFRSGKHKMCLWRVKPCAGSLGPQKQSGRGAGSEMRRFADDPELFWVLRADCDESQK